MSELDRAAALLQSEDAAGLLLVALTGDPLATLPGFTVALTGWQYRPGAEVTAGYTVHYTDAGARQATEYLYATSAPVGPPAATLSRDGLSIGVWRHPHDPRLPGLAPACDPGTVLGWLAETGAATPAAFDLTLLGYRPLRRGVLRATADDSVNYLKVLRPERAERLATRQELLAAAGLTPPLLASPAPGVLVTPAATGRPLAALLARPGDPELPSAPALVDLLDRLPAGLAELELRPAWADRLDFHAGTAGQRLPDQADRITALAARLQGLVDAAPAGPLVPTHGDFYEANILVEGTELTLIDLDAAGPGRREDDLACLLAHVAVLPGLSPFHYGHVPRLLEEWTADFSVRVHPMALFARVAAVLLSLVAGGEAEQAEHRLALAEEWTARAVAVGEMRGL